MYGGDGFNAKELVSAKNLDYPFFANPFQIASTLNAEAEFRKVEQKAEIGKLRGLTREDVDLLVSFIQSGCPGIQTEVTERATYNIKTAIRASLVGVKLYESVIPDFIRKILDEYEEAKAKMGYMAGLIAASAIGEPTTQMTLNSLDWKEVIYVRIVGPSLSMLSNMAENGVILLPIGKIIDAIVEYFEEHDPDRVTYHDNETDYADVSDLNLEVTSVDEDGKMFWKKLEAVTRHLPGGKLIKVKSHAGREIVATKSLSFLTRKNNKLVPTAGSDLKVGDYLPAVRNFPETENEFTELDLRGYLPPTDFIYVSDMEIAWKMYSDKVKGWWKKNGEDYTVPYSRGDIFCDGYKRHLLGIQAPSKRKHVNILYARGCVYPKQSHHSVSQLPEKIPMDFLTGFLFGAYIAEGCVTKTFVCISNNDPDFRKNIYDWCDRYTIGHHTVVEHDKNFEGATSTDIKIHSTMLAKILGDSCGRGSPNKRIPPWSLVANKEFIRGLLNAYFSGDGTVEKKTGDVSCSSCSLELIRGVSELLTKFGIYGYHKISQAKSNNVGSKNILPAHHLYIRQRNATRFAINIGSEVPAKSRKLEDITMVRKCKWDEGEFHYIPICINNQEKVLHANEIYNLTLGKNSKVMTEILQKTLDQDVFYDAITSIEEIESSAPKVYDLTVAETRNFCTFGGFACRDTFHSAGMSAKDVTLGVPRLKELLNATKNPSKPTCTVFLTDTVLKKNLAERLKLQPLIKSGDAEAIAKRDSLDSEGLKRATMLSNAFTELTIGQFIDSHELQYLPTDEFGEPREHTPIGLLEYEQYDPEWWVSASNKLKGKPKFPPESWVIKLALNKDKLFRYNITPSDIGKIIENVVGTHSYVMACVASPAVVGRLEIYLNFAEIGEYVHETADLPEKGTASRILTHENLDYFAVREIALPLIKKVSIQGIKGIEKTYVHQDGLTGEWIIDTQGTNIMDILSMPGVDTTRTLSDDVWEMFHAIGIEGAGYFLKKEITRILSFDGTYINPRHVSLLVDVMLRTGVITSANRDGIGRDVGPLAKGMFEKAVENIAESSAFAEHDIMKGVSAAIMFGALPEVGTGTVQIKDAEKLPARSRKPIDVPLAPKSVSEKKKGEAVKKTSKK